MTAVIEAYGVRKDFRSRRGVVEARPAAQQRVYQTQAKPFEMFDG